MSLLQKSQYGIHDLSRLKSSQANEYYRLNMPFELGIDFGCRQYSKNKTHKKKRILVLSEDRFEYQKAISDLNGVDISNHKNSPNKLIEELAKWFNNIDSNSIIGPKIVWPDYNRFLRDFEAKYILKGYSSPQIRAIKMGMGIYIKECKDWVKNNT